MVARPGQSEIAAPRAAARQAGLKYVQAGARGGIVRRRAGRGFAYLRNGRPVRDALTLRRIAALVIPPAWADVWICGDAQGHLQATGRDARRRRQYRYHTRWRKQRDETKYGRMIPFGRVLPRLRARVAADLRGLGLSQAKVLATVVRLLETTLIRVGNEEYARQNQSYGLTTLKNHHVQIAGAELHFHFRGKSGKDHQITVSDPRVARIVKRCRDLPGYELFQYVGDDGRRHSIDSADVNQYIHASAGESFTAKDFRTWAGTMLAAAALAPLPPPSSEKKARDAVATAVEQVARRLGNTRAVCRKCYIHPAIVDAFGDGRLRAALPRAPAAEPAPGRRHALTAQEKAVLSLLASVAPAAP